MVSMAQVVTAQAVTARKAIIGKVSVGLWGSSKKTKAGAARLPAHLSMIVRVKSEVFNNIPSPFTVEENIHRGQSL